MPHEIILDEEVVAYTEWQSISDQTLITCTSTTHPSSPVEGMHIYEVDTQLLKYWNGTVWITRPSGIIAGPATVDETGLIGDTDTLVNGSALAIDYQDGELYEYAVDFVVLTGFSAGGESVMNVHFQVNDGTGEVYFDVQRDIPVVNGQYNQFHGHAFWRADGDDEAAFSIMVALQDGVLTVPGANGSVRVIHHGTRT